MFGTVFNSDKTFLTVNQIVILVINNYHTILIFRHLDHHFLKPGALADISILFANKALG
jgi:hypothetical protein